MGISVQIDEVSSPPLIVRSFGWDNGAPLPDGSPSQDGRGWASKFNKSHAGRVFEIFVRFGDDSVPGPVKVFAREGDGLNPGNLIWTTPAFIVPAGGGLIQFALPPDLSGTDAAADYWLGIVNGNSGPTLGGSTNSELGVESVLANGTYDFNVPPVVWPGTDVSFNVKYDIFCNYHSET